MDTTPHQTVLLACPQCQADRFEIRILKDEGLATSRCLGCQGDFLLLDSEDYWFDAIQDRYPSVRRCACRGTAFGLELEYIYRDARDVRAVRVSSRCAACAKRRRELTIDIDYSPTDQLVRQPLVPCANPKLLYQLTDASLYVNPADIVQILGHLRDTLGCRILVLLFAQESPGLVDADGAILEELLQRSGRAGAVCPYRAMYATRVRSDLPTASLDSRRAEEAFWRHQEVIRFSSPTQMMFATGTVPLYYLQFATESIRDGQVVSKSPDFQAWTDQLLAWLTSKFVGWRGRNCFDNPEVHLRAFGEEYRSRTRGRKNRK